MNASAVDTSAAAWMSGMVPMAYRRILLPHRDGRQTDSLALGWRQHDVRICRLAGASDPSGTRLAGQLPHRPSDGHPARQIN